MPRTTTNKEVAAAFAELADLMELTGGDRFRILANRRVGETMGTLANDIEKMSEKDLTELRGIGKGTARKILEFVRTGTMAQLEELRTLVPAGVREMTALPGVGPKRAMVLHTELGVSTLDELRAAVEAGRLREVKGMGAKTEKSLLAALARRRAPQERRILLETALVAAEEMIEGLRRAKAAKRISYAGSLRRMRSTIGDIDLLAAGPKPEKVMDAFAGLDHVARVTARGTTKSSVITRAGLQVDLRVVALDEWGAALQYFTGSKDHNVKVREHAVKLGFKLSEYGLFRVKGGERIAAGTEEEVYAALGMQTPPATIREDRGEVELALKGELPVLVDVKDIKGDLHAHSGYSDGVASVGEMARAAQLLGYRYFAITDHGGGRWPLAANIGRQAEEVAELNESLGGRMKVLHGIEMSIRADGEFALPDEALAGFDLVIASIHDALGQDSATMTRRILRALQHPEVNVLGHPTARRIGTRDPISFDLETVFEAAAAHGVALEINAAPDRLDLADEHIRLARKSGCVFAINTDSHRPENLRRMRFGVATAQRGWVTRDEVINSWSLPELRRFLRKKK